MRTPIPTDASDHSPEPTLDQPQKDTVNPTMKACLRRRYGNSSALELIETETPTVKPGTVLVEVVRAGLNPFDWHQMTGTPLLVRIGKGLRRPTDHRIGVDLAGRVVAVGEGVTDFEPGDEVMGFASGALAQYALTTPDHLIAKPDNVTFDEGAGLRVAAVTALEGLRDKAVLKPGQTVLINGASGGVGTVAVQLAKHMGGEVTAVCSTRNVELCRSLGADRVIDYTSEDFTAEDHTYDVIFDNQGNHSLSAMINTLNDRGTYVLVGGPKSNRVTGPIGRMARAMLRFRFSNKSVRPFIAGDRHDDLVQLAELMSNGELRTVIDTVYPLEEVSAAMDHVASGRVRGKVIVRPFTDR